MFRSQPMSTSAFASLVVVTPRKSTPSAKPLPNPSSPTTKSTSTSTPRTSSSRPSSSTTAHCSLPTTGGASPRSLVVQVPAPGTRSLTVKRFLAYWRRNKRERKGGWGSMERCSSWAFSWGLLLSTIYSSRTRLRDMARNGCLVRSRGL